MLPSIPYQKITKKIGFKNFTLRPFNVATENMLLLIKDSKDPKEIFSAILQVVDDCLEDENKGQARKLHTHVIEMLFIELRKISNGTTLPLSLVCNKLIVKDGQEVQCGTQSKHELNLDKVVLVEPDNYRSVFDVVGDNSIILKMKEMTAENFLSFSSKDKTTAEGIAGYVESVTYQDTVTAADEISLEELVSWCGTIPSSVKLQIAKDYFGALPHIFLSVPFECSNPACGCKQDITFDTVLDFFI